MVTVLPTTPRAALHILSEPPCPLIRRLGCSQVPSGSKKFIDTAGSQTSQPSASSLVVIPSTMFCLIVCAKYTLNLGPAPYTINTLITKIW